MYVGELHTVCFFYNGMLEAVLERLPTARVESKREYGFIIQADIYGNSVDMWLRIQGDKVEVLK